MAVVTVRSTLPPFLTVMCFGPPAARPIRSTVIDAVAVSGALLPPLVARTMTSAATMTTTAPASTPMRAFRLMDSSFGRVVAARRAGPVSERGGVAPGRRRGGRGRPDVADAPPAVRAGVPFAADAGGARALHRRSARGQPRRRATALRR